MYSTDATRYTALRGCWPSFRALRREQPCNRFFSDFKRPLLHDVDAKRRPPARPTSHAPQVRACDGLQPRQLRAYLASALPAGWAVHSPSVLDAALAASWPDDKKPNSETTSEREIAIEYLRDNGCTDSGCRYATLTCGHPAVLLRFVCTGRVYRMKSPAARPSQIALPILRRTSIMLSNWPSKACPVASRHAMRSMKGPQS